MPEQHRAGSFEPMEHGRFFIPFTSTTGQWSHSYICNRTQDWHLAPGPRMWHTQLARPMRVWSRCEEPRPSLAWMHLDGFLLAANSVKGHSLVLVKSQPSKINTILCMHLFSWVSLSFFNFEMNVLLLLDRAASEAGASWCKVEFRNKIYW